jgi:hypothetical protein
VITFAVIGHNEAPTVAKAIAQAAAAAEPTEQVWFVDSASTDDSAAIAASLGADVIPAPLGKGRAMSRAAELCETEYICFLDADIESSSVNIPLALRSALAAQDADMIIGQFVEPARRIRSTSDAIYRPLVETFFPEALDRCGTTPLSGFRMVSLERPLGRLPAGFGAEVHMNVVFALTASTIAVADIGIYRGPIRPSGDIAWDAARAILDLAADYGRLSESNRPLWDAWAEEVVKVIRTRPDDGPLEGFRARLAAAASRRPGPS